MFCPECGSMMSKDEEGILECGSCGYKDKDKSDTSMKEEVEQEDELEVVEDEGSTNKPVVEAKCEDCENEEAYFWTKQTRAGDEPATKFYECTECGHTWREYS